MTDTEGEKNQLKRIGIQRLRSTLIGASIGFVLGSVWAALIGPITDGPPSLNLSLFIYTGAFTLTGAVVGAIQRLPGLIGPTVGTVIFSVLAIIIGPKDGWLMIWMMVFGFSGMIGGCVIGIVFYYCRK